MAHDEHEKPKRGLKQRLKDSVSKAVQFARGLVRFDVVVPYDAGDTTIDLPIDFETETVWATQKQMAKLFGTSVQNVNLHIQNLIAATEIEADSDIKESLITASDGKSYRTKIHNLDVIVAVGMRVDSDKARTFRKWARKVLKGYIEDGYALNGERLDRDPIALQQLAERVRAIRTSEKNLYKAVCDTFAASATDYDSNSEEARKFFSVCQDKFHWAASRRTSAQLVLERANASLPNMGVTSLGNEPLTLRLAQTGKSYCTQEELRSMQILGEQWLLYAEGMANRNKPVSMDRLIDRLDALIAVNEYELFAGHHTLGPLRKRANDHAKAELEKYKSSQRLLAKKSAA